MDWITVSVWTPFDISWSTHFWLSLFRTTNPLAAPFNASFSLLLQQLMVDRWLDWGADGRLLLVRPLPALLCKARMQYLLTCKVSRYCILALHGTTAQPTTSKHSSTPDECARTTGAPLAPLGGRKTCGYTYQETTVARWVAYHLGEPSLSLALLLGLE